VARIKYNPDYYHTFEWLHKRKLKLEWGNHKCERCNSTKNLQVYHKHYRTFGDEMPWDLIVLCEDCHKDEHYIGKPDSDFVVGVTI
jgi:5-methylcytosine-specific restriction endonuclease McrA